MTIAIDCRMIEASGVGVYLRGCLPWFLNTDNDFLLFGNLKQLLSYDSFKNVNIINCNIKPFSIRELLFFPQKLVYQINKTDVYYSPFFNIPCGIRIPVFTTIHDIIFPDMPELFSKIGLAARMWFYRRAYKKSKKMFTVSQFSKSRIEYHLGKKNPVIVTHSAIQQMYLDYRNVKKNIHKKDIIIFIGNLKKHKGLDCLLDAFLLAIEEGLSYKLLIIGSNENLRTSNKNIIKKIKSIGSENISFTGFIRDETLMEHLAEASLLVQPSLYEGFCLPPLEAMALGTKALISDIPVLKEIYEDFPVAYFIAGDYIDLKEKIIELLLNKKASSPQLSYEQLSIYNFEKTASYILEELK